MKKLTILLVEDHDWTRELYGLQLKKIGQIIEADSAQEALSAFDEHEFDLVVLDIVMPHNNGLTFLYERQSYDDIRKVPVLILSSLHQDDLKISDDLWRELDIAKFCYKPKTKPADLLAEISDILTP